MKSTIITSLLSNRQRTTSSTRSSQASGTRNSQTPRSSQASVQNPAPTQTSTATVPRSRSEREPAATEQIPPPAQENVTVVNPIQIATSSEISENEIDPTDPISFFTQREAEYMESFVDVPVNDVPEPKIKEPLKIRIEEILREQQNNRLTKLTNLTCKDFRDLLHLYFNTLEHNHYKHTRVSLESRLLITLTWLKHSGSFKELGAQFGIKKTHTRAIVMDIINKIGLKIGEDFVKWRPYIRWDESEKSTEYPGMLGALDATVQEIGRAKDQNLYYSGKHKMCCVKVQCFVSPKGRLLHFSKPIRGKRYDFRLFKKTKNLISILKAEKERMNAEIETEPCLLADSGYQGINDIIPWAKIPFKRQRNTELTDDQKEYNRKLSSNRIIVENYFSRLKQYWRVIGGKWPLKIKGDLTFYHHTFAMCAGLTNKLFCRRPLRRGAERWDLLDLDSMDENSEAYNYQESVSEDDSENSY